MVYLWSKNMTNILSRIKLVKNQFKIPYSIVFIFSYLRCTTGYKWVHAQQVRAVAAIANAHIHLISKTIIIKSSAL
jgi:hypothetical protein